MAFFERVLRRRRGRPSSAKPGQKAGPRPGQADPRLSEQMTRLLDSESQRLAHVGSWEWDAARNAVTWSEELYRIYGLGREDFDGTYEGFLERVYEPDRGATRDTVQCALRDGRSFDYEHRIVRPDGQIHMLRTRGGVVRGADGSVARLVGSCMDVTDQWQTRRRLDESLALLRATLDSTQDGIFVVDLDGRVVVCNRRARELWGLPEALVARGDLGEMQRFVLPLLSEPEKFMESERRLMAEPSTSGYEKIRFNDGRVFERYTRPQLQGDKVIGRVCSFRDVTARERALEALRHLAGALEARVRDRTQELRRKTEELQRSNAELEAFAAAASHDLSAPLRRIITFAELLERRAGGKLAAGERDMLARIRERAHGMIRLTADLLTLSRVTREELPVENVPLEGVLREVAADLDPALERARAALDLGPLPVVRGHHSLWRLMFQNLIANALKFRSPERPLRLEIRSRALPDGGVELSVEDNGIGFEDKYAREIFAPFRRLHPSAEYEGNGIGLSTCERIARRYGAQMSARGAPGRGATFYVRLPASALVRA